MRNNLDTQAKKILDLADIKINPSAGEQNDWDIKINNPDFYNRVFSQGSLGLGESYMDGWWECKKLDQIFDRLLSAKLQDKVKFTLPVILNFIFAKLFNLQSKSRAFEVGEKHYDTGNDLFSAMLGESMAYSCGYWKKAKNLTEAQFAKYDLICKKLNLKKGQKILDIGCGWGGFIKYATKNYGVSAVGVTVSKEQAKFTENLCNGLPVEIIVGDYRNLNGKFDNIVSVGMFEHVGLKNYKTYFQVAKKCLKDDGLFLLHSIGSLESGVNNSDVWLTKYIFPNGVLPSIKQIAENCENLFVIEDLHNFGADYDKTLLAWNNNFQKAWPKLKKNYSETFKRMWEYYLLSCAGAFRSRSIQLWQIVLSPSGVKGGYKSIR
jgi:cyclopropane-fatty-acyl-phospholipid synthase